MKGLNKTLLRLWRVIRAVTVVAVLVAVVLPVGLYVTLSTPWARSKIRDIAQKELTSLLGTDVKIGEVDFSPFSKVSLDNVTVADDEGKTALAVGKISGAFEFWTLLATGKIVIDYVLVDSPDVNIYRKTPDSPVNIDGIIKKLSSGGEKKTTSIKLKINNLVIRQGSAKYKVLSNGQGVEVRELSLHAYSPFISPDSTVICVEKLSFCGSRDLRLDDLEFTAFYSPLHAGIRNLKLEMPGSELRFSDMNLDRDPAKTWPETFASAVFPLEILKGSHLALADLAFLYPPLAGDNGVLALNLDSRLSKDNLSIKSLNINSVQGPDIDISLKGKVRDMSDPKLLEFDLTEFSVAADASAVEKYSRLSPKMPIHPKGALSLDISARGNLTKIASEFSLSLGDNKIESNLLARFQMTDNGALFRSPEIKAEVEANIGNPSAIAGKQLPLDALSFNAEGEVAFRNGYYNGEASLTVDKFVYNNYEYNDLKAYAIFDKEKINSTLRLNDSGAKFSFTGDYARMPDGQNNYKVQLDIERFDFNTLNFTDKYPGYSVEGTLNADLTGMNPDNLRGHIAIGDLKFAPVESISDGDTLKSLELKKMLIEAAGTGRETSVSVSSDYINGELNGSIVLTRIKNSGLKLISGVLPSLLPKSALPDTESVEGNDFDFDFEIKDAAKITRFFKLGLHPLSTIKLSGHIHDSEGNAALAIDLPYISQGDKIIDDTSLYFDINDKINRGRFYFTSHIPTKKGLMAVTGLMTAASDRVDSRIDWIIERTIPLNGCFDFVSSFSRNANDKLVAQVDFNPGDINFGDEVWHIAKSKIIYDGGPVAVSGFSLTADDQSIYINGLVGPNEEDRLTVDVRNLQMLDIFETLEIDKALVGGKATGSFKASGILGPEPQAVCDNLEVDSISYNRCVFGHGKASASWDNECRGVRLDVDITQPERNHSQIGGYIYPFSESLDLEISATHLPVEFMKPFMSAFTSDISGYASGYAHLFGTFALIDMTGDIYAENLKLKIDFTNVIYSATDSIHITPGLIDLKDITIYDPEGNKALLNGYVRHTYFKKPEFDFKVTNARNFLSYNVSPKVNEDWYGHIYGNGGATIKGWPGTVEISARMTTAPNSSFTFILSDLLEADEFSFITFRDKTIIEGKDSLLSFDDTPDEVKDYHYRLTHKPEDKPSDYNISLEVGITPDARINLVMDPAGGDQIKAFGQGNLKMDYRSADNDLRMYGIYTLDHGTYNFTLQDIIIKDFTIREGSSISFQGDPYAARLNIEASYSVNANLSDLDESFLQDKDLTRTNVPVNALLKVSGDMRQPDIDFDLEFPTLTSDVYRKVRSIVSTREMMDRQIIYLLALNRFYTPDYLSTTKGNELFSVASSTLSSQLGSMLGRLSDNWSISPNLRSDKGDFSDIEVDLALSSRLLNNRLLFNGNFGYRDKALNSNQFIGDFDIEYLLNRRGSWRLKAYNRYNDRNFYVRTATTTQGVGIMFKKDFDQLFNFLRPKKTKKVEIKEAEKPNPQNNTPQDSTLYKEAVIFR